MTTTLFGKHKDESLFRTNKSVGFLKTGVGWNFIPRGSNPVFFLVGNFGKFFYGWLDLKRDFFSIQFNLKIQW